MSDRSSSPGSPESAPQSAQRRLAVRGKPQGARKVSGSKRKRADTLTANSSSHRRRTRDPSSDEKDEEEDEGEEVDAEEDDDADSVNKGDVYDPDQPLPERRRVQKGFRDLLRDVTENAEEYLQSGSAGLRDTIIKADEYSRELKQTADATIDSRLLVSTSDLSYRKTLLLTQGSLSHGLDVDEFVSKCITYMRQGRGIEDDEAPELSSTQRQRRQVVERPLAGNDDDEDDVGDDGDMMNWAHLGRFACVPYVRRPALPGFLLGPLSVEKKLRKITKRSAPFRPNNLTETRPEVLNVDDLAKKENDLAAICAKILQQLGRKQVELQEKVQEMIDEDMEEDEQIRIMHEQGLRSTGGLDLLRFVVNPKSFGQTVENMFYVSFLVRDGRVQIDLDDHEYPSLAPVDREEETDARSGRGKAKHQAILSMDMETWKDVVRTFNLRESMIEHRQEVHRPGPGARGWYS